MKVVAVEMSSTVGSVAFMVDEQVVARRDIPTANGRTSTLFDVLETVRAETQWAWSDVELFAAGRGPGRYSGMRVALTAVQGFALPGRSAVRAVSSGAALAAEWADREPDITHFAVVGDARRNRIWFGLFERTGKGLQMMADWRLADPGELVDAVAPDTLLLTSEWARMQPYMESSALGALRWVEQDAYPTADWVGRLAWRRHHAADGADPLLPIYLHPPVNVA